MGRIDDEARGSSVTRQRFLLADDSRRLTLTAGVAAASASLGLVAVSQPMLGILLAGGMGFVVFLVASRSFVLTVLLLCGIVDIPIRLGAVGTPISPLGLLTVFYACGSWLLWLMQPRVAKATAWSIGPLMLFVAWGFASSLFWSTPTIDGVQNLLVIVSFIGLILLSAIASERTPTFADLVGKVLLVATFLAVILFLARPIMVFGALNLRMGPRSFGLFALIGIAWLVARWRYDSPQSFAAAVALLLAVGLSLSRMALGVGILLFPLAQLKPRRLRGWLLLVVWMVTGIAVLYTAITRVQALNDRFFTGDVAVEVGGLGINAMGRTSLWGVTWESFERSPWIGQGAGSASTLISSYFPGIASHPHQDYLRILHDYGLVGFLLWILGVGRLLWTTGRAWLRADHSRDQGAHVHLAAFLALIAVTLAMLTDNAIVYIFVMAPLAIMVGTSMGRSAAWSPDSVATDDTFATLAAVEPRIKSAVARRNMYWRQGGRPSVTARRATQAVPRSPS
jgi:O-antigen ligase